MSILEDDSLLTFSPLSSLPPSSPPPPRSPSTDPSTPSQTPTALLFAPSAAGVRESYNSPQNGGFPTAGTGGLLGDLPPDDTEDPGVVASSPRVANEHETLQQVRQRKGHKQRKRTLATQRTERENAYEEELRAVAAENEATRLRQEQEAAAARERSLNAALQELAKGGLTWGDLVAWVCKPGSGRGTLRHRGMFEKDGQVEEVLDLWATKNSPMGEKKVRDWVVGYLEKVVCKEAERATTSGVLMSRRMTVDESFVLKFDLQGIHQQLRGYCPTMSRLMYAFSTSKRQRKVDTKPNKTTREEAAAARRAEKKDRRVGTALCDLMGERSQNNSFIKHVMGLYLYATGAQRQVLSVLSTLGLCSSYPSLAGNGSRPYAEETASTTQTETGEDSSSEDTSSDSDSGDSESETDDSDSDAEWLPEDDDSDADSGSSALGTEELQSEDHSSSAPAREPPERDRDAIERAGKEDASQAPTGIAARLLHRGSGLLKRISDACRLTSRTCAQERLCGHVYDNINMMFRIAEQILGRKDTQENGTCATIFPLFDARPEDMQTSDLLHSFDIAPPLTTKDICHTSEESTLFHESLEHTILRDLTSKTELFAHFRADVLACLPADDDRIALHTTEVLPLPAMNIDESSITGNAEVIDTIFKELGFDIGTTKFSGIARPIFGDQLSISRLRTLMANRAGHDSLSRSYAFLIFGPGFFHHQMALTHGIIETHWGDPSMGVRNPACLSFFNDTLNRKPIVLSSLPPYRTCRDLIFTSLSACLLHCLERVSGCNTLAEYAQTVSFATFREHVKGIMATYIDANHTAELRRERLEEAAELESTSPNSTSESASRATSSLPTPLARPSTVPTDRSPAATRSEPEASAAQGASVKKLTKGDVVFENATLFLRDALVMREFTDAIKGGYSGRIIRALKLLALMYRGSGRTKYAHELLHLVHNLTHVWPKPLRDIMIKNWLVNPSGKPNSWVPVDLLQEHMNFWIKIIYKAQGSNASWDWLAMISPCIALLRRLALEVNSTLGAKQGSKHTSPALEKDLEALCDSLRTHGVFEFEGGRVINEASFDTGVVPNIVTAGLGQLQGPLRDYNRTFRQLQQRRRMQPLVGSPATAADSPPAAPVAAREDSNVVENSVGVEPVVVDQPEEDAEQDGDEEEALWRVFDEDVYEPHDVFAEEESPSLDIEDY